MIVKGILIALAVVIVGAVAWGLMRTRKVETDARQALFVSGSATLPGVNYSYKGSAGGYQGSWYGKEFLADGKGTNGFRGETSNHEESFYTKYPFRYYVGHSVRDKNLEVIVLDYNQPGNPWWLRYIRDEMVATGDNTYLGKVNVWILPNTYLSLGYFELKLK